MTRQLRRARRRLLLWRYGTGQCRTYRTTPTPFQLRGEWHVGFGTDFCQKRRGHFGSHTTDW